MLSGMSFRFSGFDDGRSGILTLIFEDCLKLAIKVIAPEKKGSPNQEAPAARDFEDDSDK